VYLLEDWAESTHSVTLEAIPFGCKTVHSACSSVNLVQELESRISQVAVDFEFVAHETVRSHDVALQDFNVHSLTFS
jgi:hypothetical protein